MYRARTKRSTALLNFCRSDHPLVGSRSNAMDEKVIELAASAAAVVDSGADVGGRSRPPSGNRGKLVVRLPNMHEASPSPAERPEVAEATTTEAPSASALKVSYDALSKPKYANRLRSYPDVKKRAAQMLQPLAVCEVYHISKSVVTELGRELQGGRYYGELDGRAAASSQNRPPRVATDVKCVHITFDNSVLRHAARESPRAAGAVNGSRTGLELAAADANLTTGDGRYATAFSRQAAAGRANQSTASLHSWPPAARDHLHATAYDRRDTVSSAWSGLTQQAVSNSPKRDSDFSEFEDEARSRHRTFIGGAALDDTAAAAAEWPQVAAQHAHAATAVTADSVVLPRLVGPGSRGGANPIVDAVAAAGVGHGGEPSLELPEMTSADFARPSRRTRQTLLQKKFDETLRIFQKTRDKIMELNTEKSRLSDSAKHGSTASAAAQWLDAAAGGAVDGERADRPATKPSLSLPPIASADDASASLVGIQRAVINLDGGGGGFDDAGRPAKKVMFDDDVYAHFRHSKYRKGNGNRKLRKRYEEHDARQFLNVKVGQS